MQYILGFFKFWRKFIIGDDWTIAATIMWGLLTCYSLFLRGVQAWYVMPLVVVIVLLVSIWRALSQSDKTKKIIPKMKYKIYPVQLLWFLMIMIAVVPYGLFFIDNSSFKFNLSSVVTPEVYAIGVCAVSGFVLAMLYKKYPALASLLTGAVTLYITQTLYRHDTKALSSAMFNTSTTTPSYGWLCLGIALVLFIVLNLLPVLKASQNN